MSQTLVMIIPIITDVGGLVGGIIGGIFFIVILSVCILLCIRSIRTGSAFRTTPRTTVVGHPQQSQPYPGQQGYPMTPYSTQPQQPPPTYPAYLYPPGGSQYPPQQAPYPNQDMSNIQQQPLPPYPGTQSTQFGFPEPQPF